MAEKRYLKLMQTDGQWIERPDLFLFVRMGSPDSVPEEDLDHIYTSMLLRNEVTGPLRGLEVAIEKNYVRGDMRLRLHAAQTLLELVRIAATRLKPASVKQAKKLVAFNQHKATSRSSPESLEREVERGFSMFRHTAHLQAAMVLGNPRVDEIENSPENTKRFLARARGLETFIDNNVAGQFFKWNPWRVPTHIEENFEIFLKPLGSGPIDFASAA